MLYLTSTRQGGTPFCDGVSRRRFLQIGGASALGLTLPDLLRAEESGAVERPKSAIIILLTGGAPHLDTFDLKPEAPAEIRGEFKPIQTKVPGMEICELMPRLAGLADRFSLVRSLSNMPDRHETHYCLSGYTAPDIDRSGNPCIGSVIAKIAGETESGVPLFASTARKPKHAPWGEPGPPGFLGSGFSAFCPNGPGGMQDLVLRGSLDQLNRRRALLEQLDTMRDSVDPQIEGLHRLQRKAFALLTSNVVAKALDLTLEPEEVRSRYGEGSLNFVDDGPPAYPLDFLAARRLIEAGVRVVTVPFCRWDWHHNNFGQAKKYVPLLDSGLSALIQDLCDRGLDKDVAVLVWGEFGRTPRINKDGGRDHWTAANFALFAGGSMKMGQVIGATDKYGQRPTTSAIHPQQVLATLYRHFGIDAEKFTLADPLGRPRFLLEHHEPISGL